MTTVNTLLSGGQGTTIPAGSIGELVSATMSNTALTGTTAETDIFGASLSLSAGIWLVSYSVSLALQTAATVGGESTLSVYLTNFTTGNTRVSGLDRSIAFRSVSTNSNLSIVPAAATTVLTVASTTTYKLRGQVSNANGTAASAVIYVTTSQFQGNFYAVRIG